MVSIAMQLDTLTSKIEQISAKITALINSQEFYYQLGLFIGVFICAHIVSKFITARTAIFKSAQNKQASQKLLHVGQLIRPLLLAFGCVISIQLLLAYEHPVWLLRLLLGLTLTYLLYQVVSHFVEKPLFRKMALLLFIPSALVYVFELHSFVIEQLEAASITIGNITISAYGLVRVLLFGSILFWLGRLSNNAGQEIIRNQQDLDLSTREIFAKLFQIALFFVVFVILLQIMGINLTTLAVFGGALGVGIGFGLQAIASNFISGIILLLDRTLSVGDYIEMEDGRAGIVSSLEMRSTVLHTFDGKNIMVPNEQFITTSFINWTHDDKHQRYAIEFQVAYDTDIHQLIELIKITVARHPQVLSGEDVPIEKQADAEIKGFGDSGIDILVEYWIEGIDDGKNRVAADLYLMIWDALQRHQIEIPFPQREVTVINK